MLHALKSLLKNDQGAVAVEYAIIAIAMFLAIIPSFLFVSSAVGVKLTDVAGYLSGS